MNNNIKAVIIEDEIPAARLLLTLVREIKPQWDIEVLDGSIEGCIKWFSNNIHPDLIFLDIHLSDGNSFELLSQVKPHSNIIFTTAYDEYAIRAFTVNSIDYILKPIDKSRVADAISKFENLRAISINNNPQNNLEIILESLTDKTKKYRTRFLISGLDKLWTLQIDNIAYFYSENRITFAVTHKGEEHILDISLDRLIEQLNPDLFFRANRQTVISVNSIKKIEPYFNNKIVVIVSPPSKDKITISKEKISMFKMWLNY